MLLCSLLTEHIALCLAAGLRTLFELPESGPVIGVTSLDGSLYVLRRGKRYAVEVYDTVNYACKHQLTVQELASCSDLASCAHHHCLYIAANTNLVYVLTPGNSDSKSWSAVDKLAGISVTPSHSLLVACYEVRKLKEFSITGQLLREVAVHPTVEHPVHAVQLTGDQFAVCHGSLAHIVNRVCIVGEDGAVVKRFGGRRRSVIASPTAASPPDNSDALSVPCHLAVDSATGLILVADSNNGRIVVLTGDLERVSEHGCWSGDGEEMEPVRLSLDREGKRLYVALNSCGDNKQFLAGQVVVIENNFSVQRS